MYNKIISIYREKDEEKPDIVVIYRNIYTVIGSIGEDKKRVFYGHYRLQYQQIFKNVYDLKRHIQEPYYENITTEY